MEQRLSLVTLGVADLARARRFYEGLGWTSGAAPSDDVVFFQAGGMIVAWDDQRNFGVTARQIGRIAGIGGDERSAHGVAARIADDSGLGPARL